jgi:hypothetical protein
VVERILGKDEVMGSIPIAGSISEARQTLVCRSPQLENATNWSLSDVSQERYGKGKI